MDSGHSKSVTKTHEWEPIDANWDIRFGVTINCKIINGFPILTIIGNQY